MNKIIIGIDNGLDGGIVGVEASGEIVLSKIMPTLKLGKGRDVDVCGIQAYMHNAKERYDQVQVILEQATKHSPGVMALCSTWNTFGAITALLKLERIRYEVVQPQKWQRAFWARPKMAKGAKFDTKAAALSAAEKLWPGRDWTKSDRASKPHDGMIDAALIAEFGRRTLG